jgi:adenine-specific DNA-methyltransferase
MMKPERLEYTSVDGSKLNLEALYQIAPSCFTEEKDEKTGTVKHVVNFKTLRQLLGDDAVEDGEEMYLFTWPGKQAARREAATPIADTLRPVPEDSMDWDTTENLYIEGDNLRVLKLLQRGYMGKVKMIYIDPPYNTGNDFVYHDDFAHTTEEEELAAGNVDEEGIRYRRNLDSNGRFHSDWCSMMYSRLLVARSLLTEDGVIFISIDDNEVRNLRNICDEVFGEKNFVAQLIWERAFAPKNDAKFVSNSHDYILMFTKNIDDFTIGRLDRTAEANARYSNPDNDPRGVWTSSDISVKTYNAACDYPITTPSGKIVEPPAARCWRLSRNAFRERLADNRIWFGPNGDGVPRLKRFLSELKFDGMAPTSILFYKEVGHSQEGAKEVTALFEDKGVFDGPKPVRLLKRLITLANLDDKSIVLDFFSGSATTAHALMQYNAEKEKHCKFICAQLIEDTPEESPARKSGYATIPDIAKERIRRAGKKIKEEAGEKAQDLDTGFRVFRLDSGNYEDVMKQPSEYDQQQLDLFADNIKADRTDLDLLFGAMLSWGVQLSLPMTTEEVDGCKIYFVDGNGLVACFAENITENVVKAMAAKQPLRVLFRDSCFREDKTKINIFELFKQQLNWDESESMQNIRVI